MDEQLQLPPFFLQFQQTTENLALGLVSARVRVRALIELLEEKGLFGPGQYDERAAAVWDRDYESLAQELMGSEEPSHENLPSSEAKGEEVALQPGHPNYGGYYREALAGFVDEAVATRVRVRAIIELLEEGGLFAPGEFEKKADAIWERDYEELAMEFYGGRY